MSSIMTEGKRLSLRRAGLLIALIAFVSISTISCGDADRGKKPYRVGLVNFISGKAIIVGRNGKESPAKVGLPVDVGMKVRTVGKNSMCEIYFNHNVIKVFGDSEVAIEVLTYSMKDNADKTSLVLDKGRVFAKIPSKLMKDERFVVKSPTCLASVRGTEFFVSEAKGKSKVSCLDGKLDVRSSGKNASVTVEDNEEATVTRMKKVDKKDIDRASSKSLEKEAEVKPVTEENSKTFEKLNEGDQNAVKAVKGRIKSLSGNVQDDKDGKYDVDMFFFKG